MMHRDELAMLRAEFVRLLTTDSPHHDARRRDFNQAVFMADGEAVWTATTLDMIMGKFDKAARNLTVDTRPRATGGQQHEHVLD